MARIIRPLIVGSLLGGLGLMMGARGIVNYLEGGVRPAYDSARDAIERIDGLESRKYDGSDELAGRTVKLKSDLNGAGTPTSMQLEQLAGLYRAREERIAETDRQIAGLKASPEYLAYEAEERRISNDVSELRTIVANRACALFLGAVVLSEISRFRSRYGGKRRDGR